MSEENKSFKVKDRRPFTAEGERRDPTAVEERPASPRPRERPEEALPLSAEAPPDPTPDAPEMADAPEAPAYPSDFSSLLLSLGSQASLLLLGDREAGGVDLSGARALITLLEVLKDKTEGRRTEEEERLLEGMLYELRMAFVARSRAAGP